MRRSTEVFEQEESDSQLVRRVVSRDESALAALYDRHSPCVYSLLRRILQDEPSSEEILQDIFLHLWHIASRFDQERGELRGWLLVMARNRALSHLRKRSYVETDNVELYAISSVAAQDEVAAQNELAARVRRALEKLPGELNVLFEMAYFEGMTHSEIAKRTGQPLGTVKTRLRSALTNLRRIFQL